MKKRGWLFACLLEVTMSQALVILCGGDSSRMGTDKALLPFGDECLLEYMVHKFAPHFDRIYLSVTDIWIWMSRRYLTSISMPVP